MRCRKKTAWHYEVMQTTQSRTVTLVSVAFFLLAVLISIPVFARPVVTWEPEHLDGAVVRGETLSLQATFTATKNLNNVFLRVVPALADFVSVSPEGSFNIRKNESVTVTITIEPLPDGQVGSLDGVIQVRNTGKPGKTQAKPLPLDLEVQPFPLPPDPGEAGRATLEGIDSDGDGVRDDVQRWIGFKYPEEEEIRLAVTQDAKALQNTFFAATSEQDALQATEETSRALYCMFETFGPARDLEVVHTVKDLQGAVVNTDERIRTYLTYDSLLSGNLFIDPKRTRDEACDFPQPNQAGGAQ